MRFLSMVIRNLQPSMTIVPIITCNEDRQYESGTNNVWLVEAVEDP